MKELYSIGEVAEIMGVSVQTLRHYNNINLLAPKYINPSTGYRYYSVDQFHLIDRIKYLQKFNLSLEEIREILAENNINTLVQYLDKCKKSLEEEISKLKDTIDDIQWYKDYFTYIGEGSIDDHSYSLHLEKRYMVAAKVIKNEPKEDFHIRLNEIRNSNECKHLKYMRQFSYILDYEALINGELKPHYLGMFIKEAPNIKSENIIEIPEGNYLCFKARILSDEWNPYFTKLFFQGKKKPSIVLANEYENSLYEYSRSVYEVQILIPQE